MVKLEAVVTGAARIGAVATIAVGTSMLIFMMHDLRSMVNRSLGIAVDVSQRLLKVARYSICNKTPNSKHHHLSMHVFEVPDFFFPTIPSFLHYMIKYLGQLTTLDLMLCRHLLEPNMICP